MSASDHVSNQFTTVYRGLEKVSHPDEIDPELIGPHWSQSFDRASEFAGKHGAIVTAQIPNKDILWNPKTGYQSKDFEHYTSNYSAIYRVMPEQHDEKETFVRPGVPVKITAMETHPKNPIRDKWSFDPPMVRNSEKWYAFTSEARHPEYGDGDIVEWHKGES